VPAFEMIISLIKKDHFKQWERKKMWQMNYNKQVALQL